MNIWKT